MQSPWNGARACNEPATLLNERRNEKIQIFNYVVGMKRYISFLKSAFCNFIFSADTDWEEITSLLQNN